MESPSQPRGTGQGCQVTGFKTECRERSELTLGFRYFFHADDPLQVPIGRPKKQADVLSPTAPKVGRPAEKKKPSPLPPPLPPTPSKKRAERAEEEPSINLDDICIDDIMPELLIPLGLGVAEKAGPSPKKKVAPGSPAAVIREEKVKRAEQSKRAFEATAKKVQKANQQRKSKTVVRTVATVAAPDMFGLDQKTYFEARDALAWLNVQHPFIRLMLKTREVADKDLEAHMEKIRSYSGPQPLDSAAEWNHFVKTRKGPIADAIVKLRKTGGL